MTFRPKRCRRPSRRLPRRCPGRPCGARAPAREGRAPALPAPQLRCGRLVRGARIAFSGDGGVGAAARGRLAGRQTPRFSKVTRMAGESQYASVLRRPAHSFEEQIEKPVGAPARPRTANHFAQNFLTLMNWAYINLPTGFQRIGTDHATTYYVRRERHEVRPTALRSTL